MNNFIWWIRYGIWTWLSDRPRKTKSFFQRGWRGWADEDTWSFDYYLAKVITGGLKQLKKYHSGIPVDIYKKYGDAEANKEWNKILDQIVEGFDLSIFLVDNPGQLNHQEEMEAKKIINKGFDLFKKYFNSLWD